MDAFFATLDLSQYADDNAAVTLVFYNYRTKDDGVASTSGRVYFDNVRVDTVESPGNYWAPKPDEPYGGGTGTWPSNVWATSAGVQGAGPQATTGALIFTDTAGVVTVNDGVTAHQGLTFKTPGYSVAAGTGTPAITLGGITAAPTTPSPPTPV
jgi:hypothetical protein